MQVVTACTAPASHALWDHEHSLAGDYMRRLQCIDSASRDAGIPNGYLKCFMMAAAYGIWLRPADVRTRAALAAAMSRHYDSSVAINCDGSGLEVIFIDREEDAAKFNDAKEPGQDDVQPEKAWGQASQRAAMVLVAAGA